MGHVNDSQVVWLAGPLPLAWHDAQLSDHRSTHLAAISLAIDATGLLISGAGMADGIKLRALHCMRASNTDIALPA